MLTFFVIGSLWWYILSGLWVILLLVAIDKENILASGILIVLYLLFLQTIADLNIIKYIAHNPLESIGFILGYVLLGILWSLFKWWLYVNEKASHIRRKRYEFLKDRKKKYQKIKDKKYSGVFRESWKELYNLLENLTEDTSVPDALIKDWSHYISYHADIPKASSNKSKIAIWITYWPLSVIWSFLSDFIHRFMKQLVLKIKFIYDGISNRAFRGLHVKS